MKSCSERRSKKMEWRFSFRDWESERVVVGNRMFFLKKWANSGLFYRLFSHFLNKQHYNFYNKYIWKWPSSMRWFQPTTLGRWVSSHNHCTRSLALRNIMFMLVMGERKFFYLKEIEIDKKKDWMNEREREREREREKHYTRSGGGY